LTSCFPCTLLRYFVSDFEMVPVAPIVTGITSVFAFHVRYISIVTSLNRNRQYDLIVFKSLFHELIWMYETTKLRNTRSKVPFNTHFYYFLKVLPSGVPGTHWLWLTRCSWHTDYDWRGVPGSHWLWLTRCYWHTLIMTDEVFLAHTDYDWRVVPGTLIMIDEVFLAHTDYDWRGVTGTHWLW
jgi:hypothetical protein